MDFETAVNYIFKFEGGYSNDPKDPGGITNFGISLRAYPELGADGIKSLTKEQAKEIYKRDYWDVCECDNLPEHLRLMTFDCAVNQGPSYAIRTLQRSIGANPDGIVGPMTVMASVQTSKEVALYRFAFNRFSRYESNPNWDRFGVGWTSRLLAVTVESAIQEVPYL